MDKRRVLEKVRGEKLQVGVLEIAQNLVEGGRRYYYWPDYRRNKDIRHENSNNQIHNRTMDKPYIFYRKKLYITLWSKYKFLHMLWWTSANINIARHGTSYVGS